jgi:hypothetical protein
MLRFKLHRENGVASSPEMRRRRTGHKRRELRSYQHLREELKRKTADLIAGMVAEAANRERRI